MKYFISFLSIFLTTNLSLVTPNVLSRQGAKTFLQEHINELKSLENVNLLSQRPKGGNDDPTPVLIEKAGYPAETHMVTTDDGYILTMHRIPHGKAGSNLDVDNPRPVVFLQHGLLCSSADWVLSDPPKALAFILSDAGYDVWLGNYRGNTYSKAHEHLDPSELWGEYWKFSWDQMGEYDLPAMLNKTLETTGQEKLFYIGHSMGTTGFMVMSNMRPEMSDKIELASFLAPVAYMQHAKSPLHLLAPVMDQIDWIVETLFGVGEFLPSNAMMDWLADMFCDENSIPAICGDVIFLLCGFDSEKLNTTLLDTIVHHTPAGASTQTLIHYGQEMSRSNGYEFCMYDYGKRQNRKIYGQDDPPVYSIDKITAPVAAYWSENDWLAAPEDVIKLTSRLPNLFASYDVPFKKWNHLDHLWGIDADTLVYPEVLKNMELVRMAGTKSQKSKNNML